MRDEELPAARGGERDGLDQAAVSAAAGRKTSTGAGVGRSPSIPATASPREEAQGEEFIPTPGADRHAADPGVE